MEISRAEPAWRVASFPETLSPQNHNVPSPKGIRVEAPGRLHMGFLDMDGSIGRHFGSVGIGLEEIQTILVLEPSETLTAEGPDSERALQSAKKLEQRLGRLLPAKIRVEQCIPPHSGLGSGTQMALAIGAGLSFLHGLNLKPTEIAAYCGRGQRSGIGIAAFETGGFIVDAGRNNRTQVPPVISRLPFPSSWRFLILLDPTHTGIHGPQEIAAFKALPAFPKETAAQLCHELVMRGLPAIAEEDIESFGAVIQNLQCIVGDHFAQAQGGRFTSPKVAQALLELERLGAVGIGQSSWGPTGFCLVDSPLKAEKLLKESVRSGWADQGLEIQIATPRARGASITPTTHGIASR